MKLLSNAIKIASVILGLTGTDDIHVCGPGKLVAHGVAGPDCRVVAMDFSIPNSVSPLADTSGDQCMVGQRDPIWRLGRRLSAATPRSRALARFPMIRPLLPCDK